MGCKEVIVEQIQKVIRKENTLNTIIRNIEEYKTHISGMTTNLNSLIEGLKDFFNDKSIYFKPNLDFYDQCKKLISGYKDHLDHLKGYEGKIARTQNIFERIRIENNLVLNNYKTFDHYVNKLKKLKSEKESAEKKGKSLSNKKITRIIRNETKLSSSKNAYLDSLKKLSTSCKKAEIESIDIICPILASLTFSLNKFSLNLEDSYQQFGRISPKFQKVENPQKYLKDLYKEVIYEEPKFESERDRLCKIEDSSFVDFFNMRAKNRKREMKEAFNYNSTSKKRRSAYDSNEHEVDEEVSDRNMVPLMSIGTISNRSGTFTSPGVSNLDHKIEKGFLDGMEENKAKKPKNPPIRSPSKSGRESKISVESSSINFSEFKESKPTKIERKEGLGVIVEKNDSSVNMSQSEMISHNKGSEFVSKYEHKHSVNSSINGFSFGEKSNFKKKSFNGHA